MPSPPQPTDPNDRTLPKQYAGKLPPSYYCRGWNAKQQKYCGARAGRGTDHPGTGRCSFHGGNHPVKHGQSRRYADITTLRVRELIAEHAESENPLDLLPELATARALFQDFLERTADDAHPAGLVESIKLLEKIAGIVESIEKLRRETAVTPKDLDILMLNMGLVVRQHVSDPEVCARISKGWLELRV